MRILFSLASMAIGMLLMISAFLQWITFEYPDASPFKFGFVFAEGLISQVINWVLVAIIGAIGWYLFSIGKTKWSEQRQRITR